jgi:hypothetical protein
VDTQLQLTPTLSDPRGFQVDYSEFMDNKRNVSQIKGLRRPTITTAVNVDENVRKRYIYDRILAVNHPFHRDCITAIF